MSVLFLILRRVMCECPILNFDNIISSFLDILV